MIGMSGERIGPPPTTGFDDDDDDDANHGCDTGVDSGGGQASLPPQFQIFVKNRC